MIPAPLAVDSPLVVTVPSPKMTLLDSSLMKTKSTVTKMMTTTVVDPTELSVVLLEDPKHTMDPVMDLVMDLAMDLAMELLMDLMVDVISPRTLSASVVLLADSVSLTSVPSSPVITTTKEVIKGPEFHVRSF